MHYLILSADYMKPSLKDEFNGYVDLRKLGVPQNLIEELTLWNDSYNRIIPLTMEQRENQIQIIQELDEQGKKIARDLERLVPGGAKVKYFSEGKLMYLSL